MASAEIINEIWAYLEEGRFFLSDISPIGLQLGYLGLHHDLYQILHQSSIEEHNYWNRNGVFALLILAAEGEEIA